MQRNPSQYATKPARMMGDKPRKPLQCWGCGGDHLIKYYPHRNGNESQVHNIQGVETMGKPLQCWKCRGNHLRRNCQHQEGNVRKVYNIQGVEAEIGTIDHGGLCKPVLETVEVWHIHQK